MILDDHTTHGGNRLRINISSQWDNGTDAEFCRRTDPPNLCFIVSDVTLQHGVRDTFQMWMHMSWLQLLYIGPRIM